MKEFRKWAQTPPLGWNSWDCFGAAVNEKQLRENAEYMAEHLKPFGWEYIVCDIQWYEPRAKDNDYNNFTELTMDGYGRLMPAPNRFPSAANGKGFKPIADYVHSLGLKFGIHIMRGVPRQATAADCPIYGSVHSCREITHHFSVCSWNTDMYGLKNCEGAQDYYNSIINMYADWGVDFIKCDDICVTEFRKWDNPYSADYEIEMIRKAIDNCGRKIVLSLSPGPAPRDKARHLSENANMWRLTGDFWDSWEPLHAMFAKCSEWEGVSRRGNWPDCDMLPVGTISKNGSCHGAQNRKSQFTKPEHYTLMTLWGIFKSPLMIGGNLPELDDFTLSLLTNEEYLKMHKTCGASKEIYRNEKNGKGVIIRTAKGKGGVYAAVFNTDSKPRRISADLSAILPAANSYKVRDIWEKKDCGVLKKRLNCLCEAHGARLFFLVDKGI